MRRAGVTTPSSSAIAAVASFHGDPGGYFPITARWNSGLSGSATRRSQATRSTTPAKTLGSKEGAEYSASTPPVFTSRATTDPFRLSGKTW